MSEFTSDEPTGPVDVDQCSSKTSILIGAVTTCVLSFIPIINMLCCLHYVVAGLVSVWHFTSRHSVTIETFKGIKIAFFSILLGGLVATIIGDALFLASGGGNLDGLKEMIIEKVEQEGGPQSEQAVQFIEQFMPDEITPVHLIGIFIFQVVMLAIGSAITGAIGGALGAAMFKKGPATQ